MAIRTDNELYDYMNGFICTKIPKNLILKIL